MSPMSSQKYRLMVSFTLSLGMQTGTCLDYKVPVMAVINSSAFIYKFWSLIFRTIFSQKMAAGPVKVTVMVIVSWQHYRNASVAVITTRILHLQLLTWRITGVWIGSKRNYWLLLLENNPLCWCPKWISNRSGTRNCIDGNVCISWNNRRLIVVDCYQLNISEKNTCPGRKY